MLRQDSLGIDNSIYKARNFILHLVKAYQNKTNFKLKLIQLQTDTIGGNWQTYI